ncbi:MAG: hypothetical protein Q9216_007161 [Gyalolechia sp. 2 TL-2023]
MFLLEEEDEEDEDEEDEDEDDVVEEEEVSDKLVDGEGERSCLGIVVGTRALLFVVWRCRFRCVRRRGGSGGGGKVSVSESELELESEELSVEDVEREVEGPEDREASRVEELVWVEEEELMERGAFRWGRRRGWGRWCRVAVDAGLGEDVDDEVEEDEELLWWCFGLRFLHKASAARRPTAVEMRVSIVRIEVYHVHVWTSFDIVIFDSTAPLTAS